MSRARAGLRLCFASHYFMLANYDKALFQPGLTPAKIPSMTMTRLARLTAWAQAQQQDPALSLQLISSDASFRRYYRAQGWIWVDAPPETEKNREFVRNAEALANGGLIAPRVRAWDAEQGLLCVSDLGDTLLLGCVITSYSIHYTKLYDACRRSYRPDGRVRR